MFTFPNFKLHSLFILVAAIQTLAAEPHAAPLPSASDRATVITAFESAMSASGQQTFIVHHQALRAAAAAHGHISLEGLRLDSNRPVSLLLKSVRFAGPKTHVVLGREAGIHQPYYYDFENIHVFEGTVQGAANSRVFLFFSPRGFRGAIELGQDNKRYHISSVGQTESSGLIAEVRSIATGGAPRPGVPLCSDAPLLREVREAPSEAQPAQGCWPEPPASAVFNRRLKVIEIAFDTDYDLYDVFDDLAETMDYLVELVARVNVIYMHDVDARLEVTFVRLFDTPGAEPAFMNDGDPVSGYVAFWSANMGGVHRDKAMFLTGRRNLGYGGVASSGAYAVCGYLNGFSDPAGLYYGDYDTTVVTHELGHNLNSPHTPDFCPPIDLCYPPPVVAQRGTIMSYCSQSVSGGDLVEDEWFHTRVRRVIRNALENDSQIAYDCNQNGVEDPTDITDQTSVDSNANQIPDDCEDCNGNSVLDPVDISAATSLDLNGNAVPDECELDCNDNDVPDDRDIFLGTSMDRWGNGVPDECDPDCDGNGQADYNQIQFNLALDIDRNAVLDSCQNCDGDASHDLAELLGARNAWVASDRHNYIGEYHAVSGVPVKTSPFGYVNAAQDLIIAPGNRVLVSSASSDNIASFHAISGAYLGDFIPPGSGGLTYATGMVITPNGNLLVGSRTTHSVLHYDGVSGAFLGEFVPSGSNGLSQPFGLAFGPNCNLYVTSGGNRVLEFDGQTGAFVRVFVPTSSNGGLSAARGLLFKPDGNLLAASYNTDAILEYDGTTGAFIGKWNFGGTAEALYLEGPWALRLGPNGNVFVTRDLPPLHDHDHEEDTDAVEFPSPLHVTAARIMEFDIQTGGYVRAYIIGDDTGLRSPTGFAFMPPWPLDCNFNMVQDDCDIADQTSADANANGVPDECDAAGPALDCNYNSIPDACEPLGSDCNGNLLRDDCETLSGAVPDCNRDLVPDACQPVTKDCNANGVRDDCDALSGTSSDCNDNLIPDECEPQGDDCNNNGILDECEEDCNGNNIPDECEPNGDCNGNGAPDLCDLGDGTSEDCNGNFIPDECELASGASEDVNGDGVLDECQGGCCSCTGCVNTTPDLCEIVNGDFSSLGTFCGEPGACTPPPVGGNISCETATMLPSQPSVQSPFDSRCATENGTPQILCPGAVQIDQIIWFHYTAPCSGSITVGVCNAAFDSLLAVYTRNEPSCRCPDETGFPTALACDDDSCGMVEGPSELTFNVTAGVCYMFRLGGRDMAHGTGLLRLSYNSFCTVPPAPQPESSLNKTRFLSFRIPNATVSADNTVAIRATLDSLHHVEPPYSGGPSVPFTAFEGQIRWVGPPQQYTESSSNPTFFYASSLQCGPHYREWNTLNMFHVTGTEVVPSSEYQLQTYHATCQGAEATCSRRSSPVQVRTTRWGDVRSSYNPPDPSVQPDISDVSALVDKFRNAPGAPIKARGLLAGAPGSAFGELTPAVLSVDFGFSHISACVDAYRGAPYPYTIQGCP